MKRLFLITILGFIFFLSAKSETTYYKVVAADGSGDYALIQDAIDAVLVYQEQRTIIKIKAGVYNEKITIPASRTNITLLGDDKDQVVILNSDDASLPGFGTFNSYTLKSESRGIRLENLTIQNGSQNRAQAVALHLDGTENIIINCNLIGNQDTVFTGNEKGRFLFTSCYIEGTTDYIFGPATCWFEECTLFSKENSYITAASTPSDNEYGYIFNNCRLKGKEDISVFLGRPWRPYAYTLFINCEMDSVIKPQGWHNWGKEDNERTSRYLEYNNSGPGSSISERTKWSKVLSEEEAAMIKREVIFPDLKSWNGNQ